MSGMATTLNTTEVCDYSSRTVVIEVRGLCRQKMMRTSNYVVKVPYEQMSKTIQRITRTGGKISSIKILSFNLKESENTASLSDSSSESKSESKVVVAPDNKETKIKKTQTEETKIKETKIKETQGKENSIPEIESSEYISNFEDNPRPMVTKTKSKKKAFSKQKTSKRKRKN